MASRRGKMSQAERAKQFMPFDPLKGFREALREKERIIVPKMELSDERKEELDRKLQMLQVKDMVTVVYFQRDEYVKVTGMVARIDLTSRILKVVNCKISFDDIADIQNAISHNSSLPLDTHSC